MLAPINIYRNLWAVLLTILLGMFSACNTVLDDPALSFDNHYLTLSRVVINAPDNKEYVDVETARILVFDANGNCVTNQLLGVQGEYDKSNNAYILNFDDAKVNARYGINYVYVVLNEATGALAPSLTANGLNKSQMDAIRSGKIPYTELIPVEKNTDGTDKELPFVMCIYDQVKVTERVQSLNLTGFDDRGTSVYGYGMRRTMAKVVLESVVGGVTPEGIVVGTTEKWNEDAKTDQIPNDTDNNELIATSAVHILGLELVNVPTHYTIQQNGTDSYPAYDGTYRDEPIAIAKYNVTEGEESKGYFDREWPGDITASGIVPFTRIDALYSIWKTDDNKGSKPYVIISEAEALKDPNKYYNWVITDHPDYPVISDNKAETISYAEYNKTAYNYGKYTIDEKGIIHLWNTSGVEMDVPNNSSYLLNSGNFVEWFKANFGNSTGNFEPGTPVAGTPSVTAQINPAVWVLDFNQNSYYIPENIPQDGESYTKLRITASIAIPTAILDEDKVNEAINKQDTGGTLIQDEGTLDMGDTNIQKYMFAKGTMAPYTADPQNTRYGYHSLKYSGLNRVYTGEVKVEEGKGRYDAITGMTAKKVVIELPLNNDTYENKNGDINNWKEDTSVDYNIYRGHEYRVKLYVTKSNKEWSKIASSASRTINIGGEELTITGKVVTAPMK